MALLPHSTAKTTLKVGARKRRRRGSREGRVFAVYGSMDGGSSPVATAGRFDDQP